MAGDWIGLFSGGKDSSYAVHRALRSGRSIERLLTVHPDPDSYMYHVPATELASLAAESMGIPLIEVDPDSFDAPSATDAGAQGDRELEPLERAIEKLVTDFEGSLAGVTAGAVESDFQASRIEAMCDRHGLACFTPLWHRDPLELARAMLEAGFEIRIVQDAARGLDESWLGRRLDGPALEELQSLNERHGVHVLGEGGEYETLVTDGPHMERPIRLEHSIEWDGTRGRCVVEDAWLA